MPESEECRQAFFAALELINEKCSLSSGEIGGNPDGYALRPGKVRLKKIWQPRIEIDKEIITSFVVNCEEEVCELTPVINSKCKIPEEVFEAILSKIQELIQRGGRCEIDWAQPPKTIPTPPGKTYVTREGEDLGPCLMEELQPILKEVFVVEKSGV